MVTGGRKFAIRPCFLDLSFLLYSKVMLKPVSVKENVSLAGYSIFRIGGSARYFAEAATREEVLRLLAWAHEMDLPVFVLGAGSNVLISDRGFKGLVLKMDLFHCVVEGERIIADAGVSMPQLVNSALRNELRGVEWAIGIPGTVGGSVRGNAGCFGGEMKDIVREVAAINVETGMEQILNSAQCCFGYRHSHFKEHPFLLILRVIFGLVRGSSKEGYALVRAHSQKRLATQDVGQHCAGCMFKNIPWSRRDIDKQELVKHIPALRAYSGVSQIPAAFLIDALGLKGLRVGNIAVSQKHANYIVNLGGGSAEQAVILLSMIKERIHRTYQILLEEEVQLVGFD